MPQFLRSFRILILIPIVMLMTVAPATLAAKPVRIGVLADGPAPIFPTLLNLFQGEIQALTQGEFDLDIAPGGVIDGAWSIDEISRQLDRMQNDPDTDLVLALGFVSSLVAARSENLRKPTFAPLVLDSNLVNLPRDGNASGVDNLNYLTEEIRFEDDVATFRDIVAFEKLALIVDKTIYESVPELAASGIEWANGLGIELEYVLSERPDESLVAKVPDDVQAVMIAALPRLDEAGRERLIAELIEEKLPSYSLIGTTPVEMGMLAATAPDSDWQRLARRNALNIQAVLLGEKAGVQPVSFRHKRQLTINMATARALDISPRFDVLSNAQLLNEDSANFARNWALADVARESLQTNLDVVASRVQLQSTAELETQARAALKPQFNTSLGIVQLDNGNAAVVAGQAADRTTTAAISGSKLLYSEPAIAAIKIQSLSQRARQEEHRSLELDVVQNATVGFLNILKSQTLVNIRRRGLSLSRTNLDLAKDRVQLGTSNLSDVYRWESDVATSRQSLLSAQAQLEQAMDALNVLLNRPINERFSTSPTSLDDPSLLVSRERLRNVIDNQRAFDRMGTLFVHSGISNSPEIKGIAAQIAASERQLLSNERSFWRPEVSVSGQVSNVIDESDNLQISQEGETDWQVALNLTLPIYQGGQRRSRVAQESYNLQQLQIRKRRQDQAIEQSVRANLHAVQSSFPSMELAEIAATSAEKNLELVQDSYSKGSASIIEFLDARDASLDADQNATNAVYDFLIDLMNLQRSTAEFDFFLDSDELDALAEKILSRVTAE
ncbi:MAG: TolC family protein [Pseudomonadota bacterium]